MARCKNVVESVKSADASSNFIDRGDYIELVKPIGAIRMIQKGSAEIPMNWYDAVDYARNLKLGGFDDWRLPTIEELKELYKIQTICGIEKSDEFWFWSSSTSSENPKSALYIGFFKGICGSGDKSGSFGCIRCVR